MFTFFKPKNKHQISYTKYVSQEQRYKFLLAKTQKEFEQNQLLIDCLQELKQFTLNQQDASQKQLLNKYITNVNDRVALKEYVQTIIPSIKKSLNTEAKHVTDAATKIKVQKLSEILCTVENMKTIKESHVLSLLRYFDLIKELKGLR